MTSRPCACPALHIEHQRGVTSCIYGSPEWPGDMLIREMLTEMRRRKMTQTDVAHQVGISPQHLSRIFNGIVDPSFQVARKLWKEIMR